MSLTHLLVPTFVQMLDRLSDWLKKAQAERPAAESEALLSARLAPDMFPLATQVRFACVQVYEAVARLRDQPFPERVAELLAEGRQAGDRPGSIEDARVRIAETLQFVGDLSPGALDRDPATPIAHALPNGMIFDLTAEQYARDWVLAQFYFHVMAAYAILRSENVSVGKADYVTHLLPALRSGSPAD